MENYDSRGSDGEDDESQKSKEEPDGAAEGLGAGLGNAEGSKERGCEGFQELHDLMVRGWIGGGAIFGAGRGDGKESAEAQEHPIREGYGLLQRTPGARLIQRSVRTQS